MIFEDREENSSRNPLNFGEKEQELCKQLEYREKKRKLAKNTFAKRNGPSKEA